MCPKFALVLSHFNNKSQCGSR